MNDAMEMVRDGIVPIFEGQIDGERINAVDARQLHRSLGVRDHFADWVQRRINDCQFAENIDYVIISEISEKMGRGRPAIQYFLTLDAAKETAMLERNEVGNSSLIHQGREGASQPDAQR